LTRSDVKIRWDPPFLLEIIVQCFHQQDKLQLVFDIAMTDVVCDSCIIQNSSSGLIEPLLVFDIDMSISFIWVVICLVYSSGYCRRITDFLSKSINLTAPFPLIFLKYHFPGFIYSITSRKS